MKERQMIFCLIFFMVCLSGCQLASSSVVEETSTSIPAVSTVAHTPSASSASTSATMTSNVTDTPNISRTPSKTPRPSQTPSLTPPATLNSEDVEQVLLSYMSENGSCLAPCFWGITPGETSLGELKNIMLAFGIDLEYISSAGSIWFYHAPYEFSAHTSVNMSIAIRNELVRSMRIGVLPNSTHQNEDREWGTYSIDNLIQVLGNLSRVEVFVGQPRETNGMVSTRYWLVAYFDINELIVSYQYELMNTAERRFPICPAIDDIEFIDLWMGESPENTPIPAIPWEEATMASIDDFVDQMFTNAGQACFDLNPEQFP